MPYSDFCPPSPPSVIKKVITTGNLLVSNLAVIARNIPGDAPVEIIEPFGARIILVRDPALFKDTLLAEALFRGPSHDVVHRIFGEKTLFLLPLGHDHSQKKTELKSRFGKNAVAGMVPRIAVAAADAVDELLARSKDPVDLDQHVLRYLFGVAGQAMTGGQVPLDRYAEEFQKSFGIIIGTASSTVRLALASLSDALGDILSRSARNAARGMFAIGRALIEAGCTGGPDNLVCDMLRRHGFDPARVGKNTALPDELLYDVSMTFAAAIFTTSGLITATVDHFYNNPTELETLRESIRIDYPEGVRGVQNLASNTTMQRLLPVMLRHSPVDLAVRDVRHPYSMRDRNGVIHEIKPGDTVAFDLATIQKTLFETQSRRLGEASPTAPLLDFLDARNNDVTAAFFNGPFQCPGRFLAVADALLFVTQALSSADGCWLAERRLQPSLVNTLSGPASMVVARVGELDAILGAYRPPPVELQAAGTDRADGSAPFQACPWGGRSDNLWQR